MLCRLGLLDMMQAGKRKRKGWTTDNQITEAMMSVDDEGIGVLLLSLSDWETRLSMMLYYAMLYYAMLCYDMQRDATTNNDD